MGMRGPVQKFMDLRSDEEAIIDGSELVNKDNPLVIGVWNLVFLDLIVKQTVLELLKNKHVDTGMGLERLAMILQQKPLIMIQIFSRVNWSIGKSIF